MKYPKLEEFEQLTAQSDTEKRWQTLIELEPHLDDVLAEVDAVCFKKGVPCRLSTVKIGDTWLYVAAGDDGRVYLGRADDLADYAEYRLGSFNASDDEIITLAITGGQRFTGTTQDLWITVRRYRAPGDDVADEDHYPFRTAASDGRQASAGKKPRYMIYHAVLGIDHNKKYFLRPAQDDASQIHGASWQPQVINDTLPRWLKYWNFSVPSAETAHIPNNVTEFLPTEGMEPVDAVCWAEGLLSYSLDHAIYLVVRIPRTFGH